MNLITIAVLVLVTLFTGAVGSGNNDIAKVCAFIFFPSAIALYLAPAIAAFQRGHRSATGIAVLNVLLGWTMLGWIGALIWAYTSADSAEPIAASPLAEAVVPTQDSKICPYCAETIRAEAIKCRFCGSDLASSNEA